MITKTQQTNMNMGQGVCEREKVHLVTNIWLSYKVKKKKELYGIGPVLVIGNAGEKYLHIPVVTWCRVQVDIKCTLMNLE